ncbi:hypothetical protein ACJZ2D_000119 [Fusarium nematophilum]
MSQYDPTYPGLYPYNPRFSPLWPGSSPPRCVACGIHPRHGNLDLCGPCSFRSGRWNSCDLCNNPHPSVRNRGFCVRCMPTMPGIDDILPSPEWATQPTASEILGLQRRVVCIRCGTLRNVDQTCERCWGIQEAERKLQEIIHECGHLFTGNPSQMQVDPQLEVLNSGPPATYAPPVDSASDDTRWLQELARRSQAELLPGDFTMTPEMEAAVNASLEMAAFTRSMADHRNSVYRPATRRRTSNGVNNMDLHARRMRQNERVPVYALLTQDMRAPRGNSGNHAYHEAFSSLATNMDLHIGFMQHDQTLPLAAQAALMQAQGFSFAPHVNPTPAQPFSLEPHAGPMQAQEHPLATHANPTQQDQGLHSTAIHSGYQQYHQGFPPASHDTYAQNGHQLPAVASFNPQQHPYAVPSGASNDHMQNGYSAPFTSAENNHVQHAHAIPSGVHQDPYTQQGYQYPSVASHGYTQQGYEQPHVAPQGAYTQQDHGLPSGASRAGHIQHVQTLSATPAPVACMHPYNGPSSDAPQNAYLQPHHGTSSAMPQSTSLQPQYEISSATPQNAYLQPHHGTSSAVPQSTYTQPQYEALPTVPQNTYVQPHYESSSAVSHTYMQPHHGPSSTVQQSAHTHHYAQTPSAAPEDTHAHYYEATPATVICDAHMHDYEEAPLASPTPNMPAVQAPYAPQANYGPPPASTFPSPYAPQDNYNNTDMGRQPPIRNRGRRDRRELTPIEVPNTPSPPESIRRTVSPSSTISTDPTDYDGMGPPQIPVPHNWNVVGNDDDDEEEEEEEEEEEDEPVSDSDASTPGTIRVRPQVPLRPLLPAPPRQYVNGVWIGGPPQAYTDNPWVNGASARVQGLEDPFI